MTARACVAVLVIVALGGVLWWVSRVDRGDRSGVPHHPTDAAAGERPAATAVPRAARDDGAAQRSAVASAAPAELAAGHSIYRIKVVDAATAEPISGAIVRWLADDFDFAALPEPERRRCAGDEETLLERHGLSAVANDAGLATVAAPSAGVALLGRAGRLYGRSVFRANAVEPAATALAARFVLALVPDRTLVLRAVDARGRPVPGISIQLECLPPSGDPEDTRFPLSPTDAAGLVRLPHVQQLKSFTRVTSLALGVPMCGGVGAKTLLDLQSLPDTPVDVVVPPHGSLEVVLLGPDGEPWAIGAGVDVHVHVAAADETPPTGERGPPSSVLLGSDGRAVVEPVLCERQLRVSLWMSDTFAQTVSGPATQGERARVELRIGADVPVLVGRAVDPSGAPITGVFELRDPDPARRIARITADASGRFRAALPVLLRGSLASLSMARVEDRSATDVIAAIRLETPLAGGVNAVGDVVFDPAPLLVAGRVEWLDGTALELPQLEVECARREKPERWATAQGVHVATPGDGRFIVRGVEQASRFRLRVRGDFVPLEPVSFAPGTEDMVIRVARAGSAVATLVVDATTPWRGLDYRLVPMEPPAAMTDPIVRHLREHATEGRVDLAGETPACRWHALAPGTYRLSVRCPGIDEPFVDIPGIEVRSGEAAGDPRLRGIELRGRVRRLVVTVTDAQGEPVRAEREAAVVIRGRDAAATWRGSALRAGQALIVAARPVDLLVVAPGFRVRELTGVFADTAVRLERAPRLRFRLAGGLPMLPPDVQLELELRSERRRSASDPVVMVWNENGGHGSPDAWSLSNPWGKDDQTLELETGEVEVEVRGSGVRLPILRLRRGSASVARHARVAIHPRSVDFSAVEDDQVLELVPDAASLREALEKLTKQ